MKTKKRTLLPVMRPYQNMREIIKQCILLEDHLFQTHKRCRDCINKHFLTIEAFAEEAITLSNKDNPQPPEAEGIVSKVRVLHHAWGQDPKQPELLARIAAELRVVRKALMKKYAQLPIVKLPSAETSQVHKLVRKVPRARRRMVRVRK